MKYNIDGRFTFSVFAENMEAANDKEAETKFKELVTAALNKGGLDVDWMETLDINKEGLPDHSEKINNALYNSGYGVKVVEMPKLVNKGKTDITDMIGEIEFWRCKLNNDKTIVVLVHGDKVYLPCNPFNYFLVCDSDCCEATKIKRPNDIFRYYWLDKNDVYTISQDGTFICIYNSESNYNPTIGQRLANVRAKIDEDVYVIHSTAYELNLGVVDDENAAYDAIFEGSNDINPSSITLTKRIL